MVSRADPKSVAFLHYLLDRAIAVRVEFRLPDDDERPTCSLKLPLPVHVVIVLFWAVPGIAVALHCESILQPLDDEVDSLLCHLPLWTNPVRSSEKFQGDIDLEPAIVGIWLFAGNAGLAPSFAFQPFDFLVSFRLQASTVDEIEEPPSQVFAAEVVLLNAMEKPNLVSGSAHGNIKPPLIRQARKGPRPVIGCDDKRQEDHIPLVALEGSRHTTAKFPFLSNLRLDHFGQLLVDELCLRVSLKDNDSDRLAFVGRVVETFLDCLDDLFHFSAVDDSLALSFT